MRKPRRPWFPLYPGDYLGDTQHLTLEEHGAYLLLLMYAWNHAGGVPADPKSLSRILGVTPQKARKVANFLPTVMHKTGSTFRSRRLDAEMAHALDVSEKRAEAARAMHAANAPAKAPANKDAKRVISHNHNKSSSNRESKSATTSSVVQRRKSPGTPPPAELEITPSMRAWLRSRGLPNGQWLADETESFLDWHRARGQRRSDWAAAWRNWMKKANPQQQRKAGGAHERITTANSDEPETERARPGNTLEGTATRLD